MQMSQEESTAVAVVKQWRQGEVNLVALWTAGLTDQTSSAKGRECDRREENETRGEKYGKRERREWVRAVRGLLDFQ
jgi:hypothetical protein